ncbi:hypothetical protein NDU88_002232 [Pleurodeles waltl]|uniref:Uncharacterized protein n=1 Tax=Pleurodeles waltl TaxID=8319 RepID=A0AAV7S9U6_PLEWA|nr:hypothetical protein NDU88_002232 [Pleurodeles waltl]
MATPQGCSSPAAPNPPAPGVTEGLAGANEEIGVFQHLLWGQRPLDTCGGFNGGERGGHQRRRKASNGGGRGYEAELGPAVIGV